MNALVRPALIVAMVLVAATGAHAASPTRGAQVVDRCGDATSRLLIAGESRALEENAPALDVRSGRIGVTYSGKRATALQGTLQVCGNVSRDAIYLQSFSFTDSCGMTLAYAPRHLSSGITQPSVLLIENCYDQSSSPAYLPTVSALEPTEVSRVVLPVTAASFRGDTVSMTVPLSKVPDVSRERFERGVRWPSTMALAQDPDLGIYAFAVSTNGSFENPDLKLQTRVDYAFGRGYLVGQDAPR